MPYNCYYRRSTLLRAFFGVRQLTHTNIMSHIKQLYSAIIIEQIATLRKVKDLIVFKKYYLGMVITRGFLRAISSSSKATSIELLLTDNNYMMVMVMVIVVQYYSLCTDRFI